MRRSSDGHTGGLADERSVYGTCTAVKTITIDIEAYERLAELTREASLLTANIVHFARVPELRILGYR